MKKPTTPKTKTTRTRNTTSKTPNAGSSLLDTVIKAKSDDTIPSPTPAVPGAVTNPPPGVVDGDDFYELLEETAANLELVLNQVTAAKNAVKARFGVKKDTPSYELVHAISYAATTGRRFKRAVDAAESVTKRHGI